MREDRPSSTALLIAASLSLLARDPRTAAWVPPESREMGDWLMQHYSRTTRSVFPYLGQPWFRAVVCLLESRAVPGMMAHYAARKLALERLVRSETAVRQLVVLGAGFDTLALRLAAERAGFHAVEIDQPATQAWKSKAAAECGLLSAGLKFMPADLARPALPMVQGFFTEKAFWVAEGLLMYFSARRVGEIFRWIHETSGVGARVAFTFMEPQGDGRVDFRRSSWSVHLWLAQRREPFAWGIRREELAGFLAPMGFRLRHIIPDVTREMDFLNVGEYLALAEAI